MTSADQLALTRWRNDIEARMKVLRAEEDEMCSLVVAVAFGRGSPDWTACPAEFRTRPAKDAV